MPPNGHDDTRLDALIAKVEALLASNGRVADAVMTTNETVKKSQASTEAVMHAVRRVDETVEVKVAQYMIPVTATLVKAEAAYEKAIAISRDEIRSKLDVIGSNVSDVHREHTGQHRAVEPEKDATTVAVAKLVLGMPLPRFLILLAAAVALILGSGVGGALWHKAFGTDSTSTEIKTRVEHHEGK